jgi:hypothetical protein
MSEWKPVWVVMPPINTAKNPKPYVLAVDNKGRMSVGYAYRVSTGELSWTFAKPIGTPTHWMPLPDPPTSEPTEKT